MRALIADTGPLYAAFDLSDQYHTQSQAELQRLEQENLSIIILYPTILEAYSLVLQRFDTQLALMFLESIIAGSELINPTLYDYREAQEKAARYPDQSVLSTHLGLFAADDWITLYSPGSQASQYAVYRSLEFLYNSEYGLTAQVEIENNNYPKPWHDNRGQDLNVPEINVPKFYILLSNMTRPYSGKQKDPYSSPMLLHKNTRTEVKNKVDELDLGKPDHDEYIWNFQRLGLICDYNGIDIHMLKFKKSYPQPDQSMKYPVNSNQQLEAYRKKISEVASKLK